MRCTVCLSLLFAALSAQAAPDALLFVHENHVWLLPAGDGDPRQVIADDPGWEYAQPTWLDHEVFVMMRLKDGELTRSHVGIGGILPEGEFPVGELQWLEPAGGAYNIGVDTARGALALTKLAPQGDGYFKAMLTVFPFDSEPGKPKQYLESAEAQNKLLARLRFSPDGKYVVAPSFTDVFGVPVSLVEVATGKLMEPKWLDQNWLVEHIESPFATCAGWLGDGRILLGTNGTGLFIYYPKSGQLDNLDRTPEGNLSVHDISVSADGLRAYYGVDVYSEVGGETQEIRMLDDNGECSILLKGAGWPDPMPAAG